MEIEKRHTSVQYESELQEVRTSLIYMGALAEKAIEKSVNSLLQRESALARKVVAEDDQEAREKVAALTPVTAPRTDKTLRSLAGPGPGGGVWWTDSGVTFFFSCTNA